MKLDMSREFNKDYSYFGSFYVHGFLSLRSFEKSTKLISLANIDMNASVMKIVEIHTESGKI